MLNLNRADRTAIQYIVFLMVVIFILGMMKNSRRSAYTPRPLVIKAISEKSLFDLKHQLDCAPGYTKDGSVYTMSLTPGGLCGAGELVRDQANYEIEDGIGGSLI